MDSLFGVLTMREKLRLCFERLQTLEMLPTRSNMEILLQTLYDLQEVYQELERRGIDGTETDTGRRDDH